MMSPFSEGHQSFFQKNTPQHDAATTMHHRDGIEMVALPSVKHFRPKFFGTFTLDQYFPWRNSTVGCGIPHSASSELKNNYILL